ncbi:MAG: hypothetical protein R3Y07_01000 [Eubacteriales bacterium]
MELTMQGTNTYEVDGKQFIVTSQFSETSEKTFAQKIVDMIIEDLENSK